MCRGVRLAILYVTIPIVSWGAAAACRSAADTFDVFVTRHRFVATVRDDESLTMFDLVSGEARELLPPGRCGRFPYVLWSPDGERLLCGGQSGDFETTAILLDWATGTILNEVRRGARASWWWCGHYLLASSYSSEDGSGRIEVRDARGRFVRTVEHVAFGPPQVGRPPYGHPLCASAGDRIVYRDAITSEVRIAGLGDSEETVVARDASPLVWTVDGDGLILAREYRVVDVYAFPEYEAWLLDLAAGEERRLPLLDRGTQFWLSPDGETAIFIPQQRRADGLPSLAIVNLRSGESRSIPGSVIAYGSDHIPPSFVRFSADGTTLYWISDGSATFAVDLTDRDARVQALQGWTRPVEFTPDPRFVMHQPVEDGAIVLYLARVDGGGRKEITRVGMSPAVATYLSVVWRPATN